MSIQVENPEIEKLKLSSTARKAAYLLIKKHPTIEFTSGRRNKKGQARAMASNVVKNRNWIKETYAKSKASLKCQKWVDDNPEKTKKTEIRIGLEGVLNSLNDRQLSRLSKHLSGDAFDVRPITSRAKTRKAKKIKRTIRRLPGITKFLAKEGGLVRWHAQF